MSDLPVTVDPSVEAARAEALEWGRKPRARGLWYVTEHMVRSMRAYGWTIVVGAVGQPIVYLLGLAVGLAAIIQLPIEQGGQEVSYLVFVAPALLMTASVAVASEELSYPVISGFKWRRLFFGFSASPLSPGQIAGGVIMAAAARMGLAVVAYYLFIWAFQAVPNPLTGWLMIPIGVLAGLSFGIPYAAYAASITEDKGQFALVQRFVFMPMFLFSATFYPLTNLPIELRWIAWISPLWHATELGRVVSYGMPISPALLWAHVLFLLVLAIGGYIVCRRIFQKRLAS
ncbi:ABC transporter permease [Microbacterium aoyamense]|uniref:Transport permease protein n=1 Tax=Microbacterium aoyamense TaxID=344166 RepID=A0ABP5B265_9MICO|nr:ABC transporter permease [Microbacterium aoyamense]